MNLFLYFQWDASSLHTVTMTLWSKIENVMQKGMSIAFGLFIWQFADWAYIIYIIEQIFSLDIKGLVHSKLRILSLFIYPHANGNSGEDSFSISHVWSFSQCKHK